MKKLAIGLLGGTFDPPHVGHLWLAEAAREQLGLARVLFLPVGTPPHKEGKTITAVSHRLTMTQLAIQDNPAFTLDTTDADRKPPHTTVTLLPQIQTRYPDAQLWLLIGADSLRDLPAWVEPQRLIQQCQLAVLPRPGVEIDWEVLETAVPHIRRATQWLDGPSVSLSATQIRHWAAAGRSLRYLTPPAVLAYIQQHGLYRQEAMG
ncbi:MAG TPA: nicotinate (nicotinamide) nucleotide adenylyltransferase [Chloroflexota bacterium]|nr:nicotinate (nicotinamide) nucleotide adenylyltransferase [Chloroflexota bacterium]